MVSRPSGSADEQLDWHPERMTSYRCDTGMASLPSGSACACARWKGGHTPCRIGGTCLLGFLVRRGRRRLEIGLSPLGRWALSKNPEHILDRLGWVLHWTEKLQLQHL